MAEIVMNGILDSETSHYYHICFFTDTHGPNLDDADAYIFIPKPVCRILDPYSISILDWYIKKKKLHRFQKGRRTRPSRRTKEQQRKPSHADLFRSKPTARVRRQQP